MAIELKSVSISKWALLVAGTAIVYFLTAKFSLLFAFEQTNTSPVWPPAGIGLLAVLFFGYRIWPGILLGIFIANFTVFMTAPTEAVTITVLLTSLSIAIGSTLEPVLSVFLIRRFIGTRNSLDRGQDVFVFVFIIALGCFTSSIIGPTSLCISGFASWNIFGVMSFTWWLGDLSGVLIVAPIFMGWKQAYIDRFSIPKWIELSSLFVLLCFVVVFVFFSGPNIFSKAHSLEYLVIPFLLWFAFRFGQQISAIMLTFTAGMAIWATTHGSGPFVADSINTSLVLVQSFVCVLAITINVLSATISEKRVAIEDVRKSEERFNLAMNFANDGLFDWNLETNEIYFSPVWKQILGYSPDEIKNNFSEWERLCKAEDVEKSLVVFNEVIEGKRDRYEIEFKMRHKDGHWVDILSRGNIVLNDQGKAIRMVGTHIDITDRKKAEIELRLKNLVFESAITANSAANKDGILTNVNNAFLKFWGYENKEDVIGKSINEFIKSEDDTIQIITSLDKSEKWEGEYTALRKDGTTFNAYGLASTINDALENITGYQSSVLDISDRKKAETEKYAAQKNAGEKDKLALVGQIAGKMAHDFNNVLAIIMGNAQLALLDCKEAKTKNTLKKIFEQTLRGKNLTKNLVAFAKDQEPKQEFFRLNEKIDLVIALLKKDLEGIEVIKEEKSGLPELLADPGMIEHGLVNLIQNSIHALSMVKDPKIIIRTYKTDDNLCFEIEDNGCGIPKEHLENIYEPSFTLKGNKDVTQSYKSDIKGTGYGMANVKKYIEMHKGNIFVESKSASGTKFTIKIPIVEKELTSKEKKAIQKEAVHFEKYILLVEDEQSLIDVQYRILTQEPCNHKVDMAINGQVAMDFFDRNQYDFVSLDYILPGNINGMDVYNYIRETNKNIPILFVSGNIEFLESIKELKLRDFNIDHLSKPCQNKDYVNSINKLLDQTFV